MTRKNDVHVVPTNQEHDADPQCWCRPESDYEDAVSGGRVWLHRRAHDLPHREPVPVTTEPKPQTVTLGGWKLP